jgi:hypothetical protein
MSETIAITDAITTIAEAERKFRLIRNENPDFFWEWQRCSGELTEPDISQLADLRRRYVYHQIGWTLARKYRNFAASFAFAGDSGFLRSAFPGACRGIGEAGNPRQRRNSARPN